MNAKMKLLSLAMVGLCGYAGSALAVCPTGPTTAEGGAWTSKSELPSHAGSPVSVVAGGLDASACKLTVALQANATSAAATVRYTHAAPEPNYRFQFLVDTTNLTAFSASANVTLFNAPSSTVANGSNSLLKATLIPGTAAGTHRIRFIAAKGSLPFTAGSTIPVDLTPGVHRVEGKLTVGAGAAGGLTYWIDAPVGTTEPAACGTCSVASLDNGGWGGVNAVVMGLSSPASAFATTQGGKIVGFDTFDSRRQTYIGH
ncbi:MAG: hypothetical protein ABIW82_13430 [Dokdonella sp.]